MKTILAPFLILLSLYSFADVMHGICLGSWPCPRNYVCERCVRSVKPQKKIKLLKNDLCEVEFEDGEISRYPCPLKKRKRRPEDDLVDACHEGGSIGDLLREIKAR